MRFIAVVLAAVQVSQGAAVGQVDTEELEAELARQETLRKLELVQAQLDADAARLKAEIATAQKTQREAIFGETIKPREGSISVGSKVGSEATISAYDTMGVIAAGVAREIQAAVLNKKTSKNPVNKDTKFLLVPGLPSANDQTALAVHPVIGSSLSRLIGSYCTELDKIEPVDRGGNAMEMNLVGGAVAGIQAGLAIAALFRSDLTYSGVAVTPSNNAFTLSLSAHLRSSGAKSVSTTLFPHQGGPTGVFGQIEKIKELLAIGQQRVGQINAIATINGLIAKKEAEKGGKADEKRENLEIEEDPMYPEAAREKARVRRIAAGAAMVKLEAEIVSLRLQITIKVVDPPEEKPDKPPLRDTLAEVGKKIDALNAQATSLFEQLAAGKISGIAADAVMRADQMKNFLGGSNGSYVVFTDVVFAGGTNLAKKSLLTTSFRVSGGAVVTFLVIGGGDSAVVAADTYYYNRGFYEVSPKKVAELPRQIGDGREQAAAKRAPRRKIGKPGARRLRKPVKRKPSDDPYNKVSQ